MAKVIGEMGGGDFLVQMHGSEITKLAGYAAYRGPKVSTGFTFDVAQMFEQLEGMAASQRNLRATAGKLRVEADRLDRMKLPGVIFNPKEEPQR